MKRSDKDTVVLDMLSNTVATGSNESGMPAYPYKDSKGTICQATWRGPLQAY